MEREDTSGSLARMGKSLVDKETTTEGIIHGHTGRRQWEDKEVECVENYRGRQATVDEEEEMGGGKFWEERIMG